MVVESSRRSKLKLNIIPNTSPPQSPQRLQMSQRLELQLSKFETVIEPESGDGQDLFTERVVLTIFTLAQILQKNPSSQDLVLALLVHTVLIGELKISNRRQQWTSLHGDQGAHVVQFLSAFAIVSRRIMNEDCWRQAFVDANRSCDIIDLIDGRLFQKVVHQMAGGFKGINLSHTLVSRVITLTEVLYKISGVQLHVNINANSSDTAVALFENLDLQESSSNVSVLPFSNRVFDRHLASISISINNSRLPEGQSARIFREVSHWHNAKRRLDSKLALPISEREKSRALRKNQFFMAEMQAYAASLTNAAGMLGVGIEKISDFADDRSGQAKYWSQKLLLFPNLQRSLKFPKKRHNLRL